MLICFGFKLYRLLQCVPDDFQRTVLFVKPLSLDLEITEKATAGMNQCCVDTEQKAAKEPVSIQSVTVCSHFNSIYKIIPMKTV